VLSTYGCGSVYKKKPLAKTFSYLHGLIRYALRLGHVFENLLYMESLMQGPAPIVLFHSLPKAWEGLPVPWAFVCTNPMQVMNVPLQSIRDNRYFSSQPNFRALEGLAEFPHVGHTPDTENAPEVLNRWTQSLSMSTYMDLTNMMQERINKMIHQVHPSPDMVRDTRCLWIERSRLSYLLCSDHRTEQSTQYQRCVMGSTIATYAYLRLVELNIYLVRDILYLVH
jgi:hypothetical protein